MCRHKVFLVCMLFLMVSCERRAEEHEESYRKGKFLTFNTVDDEIKVELDLTIPFITIPAKKAMNSVYGMWSGDFPTINVNPATLAVGGALVLTTTVLLPFVLKAFSHQYPYNRYSRLIDNAQFSTDSVLDFASKMLADGESVRGCTLRVACWTAQRRKMDSVKILHQVMSNNILSTMINSTAIEDAMLSGRKGRDCATYTPCPLKEEHIPMLLSNFAVFTSSFMSQRN